MGVPLDIAIVGARSERPSRRVLRRYKEERHAVHLNAAKAPVVERRGTKLGLRYRLLGNPIAMADVDRAVYDYNGPAVQLRGASLQHNAVKVPLSFLIGTLTYRHSDRIYTLSPGESLFFDGDVPHGPESPI